VLAPAAPSSLTASASSSSEVDLLWADVDGESGFRVERSSDGAGGWSAVGETGPGGTSWSDGGLSQGTTYYYRVVATNLGGDSPPSNVASATTSIDPASPTTVTAVASSPTQIDLEWTDVANETGYRLERSDGSGGWTTVATTGQDVTSSSDTGLTPGTTYAYRVFAMNAAGDSPASEVASATTPPDPGPDGEGATSPPDVPGGGDLGAAMASERVRVE
jgi:fibronectin type 3 domain-containing protein